MKSFSFSKAIAAKIIFWLIFGIFLIFAITPRGYAQVGETQTFPYTKKFVISGYYSPLPNQEHYFKGTYERDVRLNGEGVHAADGSTVYPGIAAAPSTFPFGTKMAIPGIGVVAVHDRGGAIKNNRIDVWMGEGEVGLQRALGWGMRTIDVTVYGLNDDVKESVNFENITLADLSKFSVVTEHFRYDLAEEDEGYEVLELQRFLKKLGYGDIETTGYFGSETVAAVKKFQLDQQLISSDTDPAAGNFGPRSRVALELMLNNSKDDALKNVPLPPLQKGSKGEAVQNLQKILSEFGFLKAEKINGIFDESTFDALYRFQIDIGAVQKRSDFGAGYYGPKTQSSLKKFIADGFTPSTALGATAKPLNSPQLVNTIFTAELKTQDQGSDVVLLQEELRRLNLLGLMPTGYYGKTTEHAVFKFQQSFGIINDEKDTGAGYVGPQTLAKLNEISSARKSQGKLIASTTEQFELVSQRVNSERILVVNAASAVLEFSSNYAYGSRGADVEQLQKVLKKLGFFPGRLTTEYFGDITKKSVMSFQKGHGLTESGDFDEPTRRILNKILQPL